MSDAEYEEIKNAFPTWANEVIECIKAGPKNDIEEAYYMGRLSGLTSAMIVTKQCSRAYEFTRAAEEREVDNV